MEYLWLWVPSVLLAFAIGVGLGRWWRWRDLDAMQRRNELVAAAIERATGARSKET